MKFSYQWIRELVDGLEESPEEVERLITIHTAECEGVEADGDDHIIEVDNKSLTHRPDLWGHHGMAREVAAITGRRLKDPVKRGSFAGDAPIEVEIEDHALSPRYSALVFENVTVQPSPEWLAKRLESVGINAINNIVDVTNYVLAEIAQPMHAFDAEKLTGNRIIVRSAQAGEKIAALNDEGYQLDPSNLVIADAAGPAAIAGVIGGSDSAISDATTRIVLESANFNASSVRKTSSKLRLRTDASQRFEKSQDPVNTIRGLERAFALLEEVSPGIRLLGGLADNYRPLPELAPILLPLDWLARKLGREVPAAEVRRILEALAFEVVEVDPETFSIGIPSWRATKDISIKEDLVEEVGRMIGYDSITPAPPLVPAQVPPASPSRVFQNRVRDMTVAQGFTEVYNYSFVSEEMLERFGLSLDQHVQVANPIAADQNLLRSSLLPGIWSNIQNNLRHFDYFRLFEIGHEIYPDREVPHFVAAIFAKGADSAGPLDPGAVAMLELKRLAECLAPGVSIRPAQTARMFEHPERSAEVVLGSSILGRLFEFHPRLMEHGREHGRAAVLDLDLAQLEAAQPKSEKYRPLRRFPTSAFDLSVIAPARSSAGDIQGQLAQLAGDALVSIAFLRDFQLPTGERSLSYRLTVGASDRTLSTEEAGVVRARLIEGMRAAGFDLKV